MQADLVVLSEAVAGINRKLRPYPNRRRNKQDHVVAVLCTRSDFTQHSIVPQPTHAHASSRSTGFLDLSAEIRNRVYREALVSSEPIDVRVGIVFPTSDPEEDIWSADGALSLLQTCREIYHQASSIYFGENTFRIQRGEYRSFKISADLTMPAHLVRKIILVYPIQPTPGLGLNFSHIWSHLVFDSLQVTSRFRKLSSLRLDMEYNDAAWNPTTPLKDTGYTESLGGILSRDLFDTRDKFIQSIRGMINGLNALSEAKVPRCVEFYYWTKSPMTHVHESNVGALNEALTLAVKPKRR